MNRRSVITAAAFASALGTMISLPAGAQSSPRCVFMDEREGAFVLEGTGVLLTEPFPLDAGTYRIEVEVAVPESNKSWMIDAQFYIRGDGRKSGSFTLTSENKVPGYGSGAITARETGEYVVEVKYFDDDWKIVLTPI